MRAPGFRPVPDPTRRGSVILVAMGMGIACTALALGYLSVARLSVSGGRDLQLAQLAQQSAREGAAHALAATLRSYLRCASAPTLAAPTHYRQAWSLGFRAIDSLDEGAAATRSQDFHRFGRAGTAFDDNGNDTGIDESPLDMELEFGGALVQRPYIQHWGVVRAHYSSRWFEPGFWHSDPTAKPTSFHLYTRGSDLTTPVGNDPAVHFVPDTPDDAAYFDDDLLPVPASRKAEARYRLRYAVAIEDLSGHIPFNTPGEYKLPTPSAPFPATYPISAADGYAHREIDHAKLGSFLPGMSSISMSIGNSAYWPLQYALHGLAAFNWSNATPKELLSLYDFSGAQPVGPSLAGSPTFLDDYSLSSGPDGIYDDPRTVFTATSSHGINATWAGPPISFDIFRMLQTSHSESALRTYTFSLFAPHLQATSAPTAARDTYPGCDHPVQINIPTMTREALLMMLHAHLPAEPRTYQCTAWTWYVADGWDVNGWANWKATGNGGHDIPVGAPAHMVTIAANMAAGGPIVEHYGANFRTKLPGWDPAYPIVSPATDWTPELGRDVDLATGSRPKPLICSGWDSPSGMGLVPGDMGGCSVSPNISSIYIAPKIIGMDSKEYYRLDVQSVGSFGDIQGPSYVYSASYWWDVHAALLHSLLVTVLAWHGDDGSDSRNWKTGNRPNGLKWPAGTPIGVAGAHVLDRDTDGDGQDDAPSLLDSVEEVDRLFVRNMGENFGVAQATPSIGLRRHARSDANFYPGHGALLLFDPYTANSNLKMLRDGGDHALYTQQRLNAMELVLNDTRLSFFGSSPQYPGFRPIDFDGDGKAWCSCYTTAGGAAYVRADADGDGFGDDQPDKRFTLTGNFVFRPSSFYRAFIRGEVFDQLKGRPAAEALLDTAFVIDADGSLYDVQGRPTADWSSTANACQGVADSTFLYQRWLRHPQMGNNLVPVVP
ncbi:MAG: hypothetical protein J0M02_04090 [Planctomycetes bacterium]|nr:hypothetical protein [Planctomycetota bacterium]